jgi:hypothetical protein
MQNTYHAKLKLPINFQVDDLTTTDRISHYTTQHADLKNLLRAVGIRIQQAQRFYTPPGGILVPHADGEYENNYTKLNYVFGGRDSQMIWHRLRDGCTVKKMLTPASTKYLYASPEDLIPVFSANIGFPSLVNAGQFHSVLNSDEPRICYSFVLAYLEKSDRISWQHAIERLEPYIELTI